MFISLIYFSDKHSRLKWGFRSPARIYTLFRFYFSSTVCVGIDGRFNSFCIEARVAQGPGALVRGLFEQGADLKKQGLFKQAV